MDRIRKWITLSLVVAAILVGLFYPRKEEPVLDWDKVMDLPGPVAARSTYLSENYYWEGGFLRYKDREHRIGVDVSSYQGDVDWQQVADSGVQFAVIRAGYRGSTAGELYVDDSFYKNLQQAKDADLAVGVYFFSQAVTAEEAREEAVYVCELLDGADLELPVYYDWEYLDGRVPPAASMPMTECAIAFCEEVKDRGYLPGVYFNQDYGYNYLDLAQLRGYHLWLAEYGNTPAFTYHYDCVQYTDSGSVPGISGPVDLDLLFLPE